MITFTYFLKKDSASYLNVPPHYHSFYELIYYYKANGFVSYSQKKAGNNDSGPNKKLFWSDFLDKKPASFNFTPNTAILLEPYNIHNEVHYKKDSHLLTVGFTVTDEPVRFSSCQFFDKDRKIMKFMQEIENEFLSKNFRSAANISSYISLILSEIFRDKQNSAKNEYDLKYIINYFDEYFMTPISIEDSAALLGYSYDHFILLFKKHTGMTPRQYIIQKRLDHALYLMETTSLSLKDIAATCGYEDYIQFHNIFKKHFGHNPSRGKQAVHPGDGEAVPDRPAE